MVLLFNSVPLAVDSNPVALLLLLAPLLEAKVVEELTNVVLPEEVLVPAVVAVEVVVLADFSLFTKVVVPFTSEGAVPLLLEVVFEAGVLPVLPEVVELFSPEVLSVAVVSATFVTAALVSLEIGFSLTDLTL